MLENYGNLDEINTVLGEKNNDSYENSRKTEIPAYIVEKDVTLF